MPQPDAGSQSSSELQLSLDEDIQLHQTGWRIQHFAWIIIVIALIFAALGLFGTGPLSSQVVVVSGDSARYERFMRYESEAKLSFHVKNVRDTLRISFPQRYRQYIDVTAIDPTPEHNSVDNEVVTYYFPANGDVTVHCTLMAIKPGSVTEVFEANDHRFEINHLIYP